MAPEWADSDPGFGEGRGLTPCSLQGSGWSLTLDNDSSNRLARKEEGNSRRWEQIGAFDPRERQEGCVPHRPVPKSLQTTPADDPQKITLQ